MRIGSFKTPKNKVLYGDAAWTWVYVPSWTPRRRQPIKVWSLSTTVFGPGAETTHPSGSQLPEQLVSRERSIVHCRVICKKVECVRLPDAVGIKDECRVFSAEPGDEPTHACVSADFDNRRNSYAGQQGQSPFIKCDVSRA
jgi:hypothetical protein